ncbi:MAG: glucose-6-phosphate isomerase [Oscillospiraceae bacterium]|jgi:glucose-6-phosphate isomerase|nr:glucose-6-phosphate isomerase [Oscillospiraceae bacterium]
MAFRFDSTYAGDIADETNLRAIAPETAAAHAALHTGTGKGSDFLGWLTLPRDYDKDEHARIKLAAEKIGRQSQVLVVIGIGGSYLGARAAIEAVQPQEHNGSGNLEVCFAGNSLSPAALSKLLAYCGDKDVSLNVISKSGTTTECAVVFRIFKALLERKYGKAGAAERIYATTEYSQRSKLYELAQQEGYECFLVPDPVGGRYSVLTAVGLLPIAAAGVDTDALLRGARDAMDEYSRSGDLFRNDTLRYAAIRSLYYRAEKKIEFFAAMEPDFALLGEWFKQLFAESEGKDGKGIFPASAVFTTDLHSMGQYVQEGERTLFETLLSVREPAEDVFLTNEPGDPDGLNFLAGKPLSLLNQQALSGTRIAHFDGGVPNLLLEIDRADAYHLGWLIYFFEKSCAVSGYVLGVNPFDQPGVEAYKNNMFALLGKPGYERERAALEARLNKAGSQ